MTARENRIIVAGLVLGAALGGLTVMVMRMREARRMQSSPEPLSALLKQMSWQELLSIGVAALTLARRISGLPDSPGDDGHGKK